MDREKLIESNIPPSLWKEIERVSWHDSELPGHASISLNMLEDILEAYFKKDNVY